MSTTLSRRIRRIGLLPTTFKETKEQRLAKGEDGKPVEKTITLRKPIRNREQLSEAEIATRRNKFIAEARAARKARKGTKITATKKVAA